jgi:uncharacterized protein (TIGR00730 family)
VTDTVAGDDARPDLGPLIEQLLDAAGAQGNRDQLRELIRTVVRLAHNSSDRLDLKIANAALREMSDGFEVFAPYREVRKITMFGSARTARSEPLYAQARDLAARLAAQQWSTVTGAGPGIMAAGLEGAGIDHSFGINIRLPFEQGANEFIAQDPKLVSMKYFFTRKLLLVKESHGYAVLPGGFGTLDESFELLTLLQTGKATPAPVVLLDVPGGGYWEGWERFVMEQVEGGRLVGPYDRHLYLITDDVGAAAEEIVGFYRNYQSIRHVGDRLVIRLRSAPSADQLADLSARYADICTYGAITALDGALSAERRPEDHPELPRVALHFDRVSYARLRMLINELNALAPSL